MLLQKIPCRYRISNAFQFPATKENKNKSTPYCYNTNTSQPMNAAQGYYWLCKIEHDRTNIFFSSVVLFINNNFQFSFLQFEPPMLVIKISYIENQIQICQTIISSLPCKYETIKLKDYLSGQYRAKFEFQPIIVHFANTLLLVGHVLIPTKKKKKKNSSSFTIMSSINHTNFTKKFPKVYIYI